MAVSYSASAARVGPNQPRRHVIGRDGVRQRHQRPRSGHHAMPLILGVGGVAQALAERVAGVLQRPHQRRVIRHLDRVEPVRIAGRIEQAIERVVVDRSSPSAPNTERTASATTSSAFADQSTSWATLPSRLRSKRSANASAPARAAGKPRSTTSSASMPDHLDALDEGGIVPAHRVHHRADHFARFVRRVRGLRHPHQAIERDAGDGVDHRRERRQRNHVARRLDRLLLGFLLERLQAIRAGFRRDVAQPLEDREGVVLEDRRQPRVALPRLDHGALEHRRASPSIGGT